MSHVCVVGTRGVPNFVGGVETICQKLYPLIRKESPSYKITIITRLPYNQQKSYQYENVDVKVIRALKISGFETFFHTFVALCYARIFITHRKHMPHRNTEIVLALPLSSENASLPLLTKR